MNNSKKEEQKRKNEVKKQFTLNFEKKIAKLIPPKLQFKGNVSKRKLIREKVFSGYISNLHIFKNYIIFTVKSVLYFYTEDLKLIFSQVLSTKEREHVLCLNLINDETIVVSTTDKVRIFNFYEKEPTKITSELIQEIEGTEYFGINEKLSNGYLLLGGIDRKFRFYELQNKNNQKISIYNKYQSVFSINKVHNVYDDGIPGVVDLNNGRIFSWGNDDKNIKVMQYYPPSKVGIIKSKNGICLHNAGLICDKYLLLMGLRYPKFYSWLMDTETLDIVKKWETPQNDCFDCLLCENKFIYSSNKRIACDEFCIYKGGFYRKTIYESYFNEDKTEDFFKRFGVYTFLNENTFITSDFKGKLMIFSCEEG